MQHLPATQTLPNADPGKLAEDLFSVLGVLRRGWPFIAVSSLVCLTLALIYVSKGSASYQASARLLVLQHGGRLLPGSGGDPLQGGRGGEDSLSTHVMVIRSPIIVERALASAGVKGLTTESVVDRLTVTVPDPAAKVLQVGYKAGSRDEASRVIAAVIENYEVFLKNNYQKNSSDTIKLFTKARDELSLEVTRMEQEYLEYRQRNPSYTTDEKGRSSLSRRIDQWEQAANQAMVRSLQLQSQLELGRKLFGEGAEPSAVAGALNRMGSLSGDAGSAPPLPEGGGPPGSSHEQLEVQLDDLVFQRLTAARLLDHLRADRDAEGSSPSADDEEVARAFEAEPSTVELRSALARAESRHGQVKRLSRSGNDPSVAAALGRVRELRDGLGRLWRQRKAGIASDLARSGGDEAVRRAEAEFRTLSAKEAALREGLAQVKADRLLKARRERERWVELHGPKDPKVRQFDQQIARLEDKPAGRPVPGGQAEAQPLLGSIEQSIQAIEAMRARIHRQFEKDLVEAKQAEIGLLSESNLRNNLERQRTLFNSVVDQLKQAQLVSDFGSITAQTINPPSVQEIRPHRVSIFLGCLFLGVGLGAGIAFVADQLDSRIRSLPEMRRALNLGVLGVIPALTREQIEASGEFGLVCHALPRSFTSEAFKSVRTNFEYLRRGQKAQVVLVTSPQSGDGKSTTASNLAISLAHAGRKVLLIDADLRRPTQHQIYGAGRERGFPHVLKDILPLRRVVQPSPVENLELLLAGPEVSNPAELLASHHLARCVEEMRQFYDVVIFDSPPLLAVADPSIIAAAVDAIVLVVRTTSTCRPDVERTVELLRTIGTPVLGAVINGITPEQMGPRYGYGYGYGTYGTYGGAVSGPAGGNDLAATAERADVTNGMTPR